MFIKVEKLRLKYWDWFGNSQLGPKFRIYISKPRVKFEPTCKLPFKTLSWNKADSKTLRFTKGRRLTDPL